MVNNTKMMNRRHRTRRRPNNNNSNNNNNHNRKDNSHHSSTSSHDDHVRLFLLLFATVLFTNTIVDAYDPFVSNHRTRSYGTGYIDPFQSQHHYQSPSYVNSYHNSYEPQPSSSPSMGPYAPTPTNYYVPYRKYYKHYLPGPQFCPETGRTVCSKVSTFYPLNEVYSVVTMARAKRFNISSEFVDESQNDPEPRFEIDELDDPAWAEPEPFHRFNGFHPQQPINVVNSYGPYGHRATVSPVYTPSAGNFQAFHQTLNRYKRQTNDGPIQSHSISSNEIPIEPICPSRSILIEPKAALNDRRQWKFIVNLSERDSRLKQAIKVEVCTTPNQPCSSQINLPFGFISRCKQKYIKKKLISLDPSGQSISSENFFAPSCCVCEVIRSSASISMSERTARVDNMASESMQVVNHVVSKQPHQSDNTGTSPMSMSTMDGTNSQNNIQSNPN